MTDEYGDEYDCDACGDTHRVERGKGLRVAGSSKRLDPSPYVRCPVAGVVRLDDEETTDTNTDEPTDTNSGEPREDEWP